MTRLIALTHGGTTVVSDEDYERLSRWRWQIDKDGYVIRSCRHSYVSMARLVLDAPRGIEVDHIDGNRLDNTRENLRLATRGQQCANTRRRTHGSSRYKGVFRIPTKNPEAKPWRATISSNGVRHHLGCFASEEEAAQAYNTAAAAIYGEFARLNEIGAGEIAAQSADAYAGRKD